MSYILDALRRAEAERERGALPHLHSQPASVVRVDPGLLRRAALWRRIGFGAGSLVVIALAAGLGWRWSAWLGRPAADPPEATAGRAAETSAASVGITDAAPPAAAATSATLLHGQENASGRASVAESLPALPSVALTRPDPAVALRELSAGAKTAAVPASAAVAPAPGALAATAASAPAAVPLAVVAPAADADRRVPRIDELPEALRRELPPLAIGGLVQLEDPPRRSLVVNGAIVMEGETVQPELLLEQVRPGTATLRYKGVRFLLPF